LFAGGRAYGTWRLSGAAALDIEREAVRVRRFAIERLTHPETAPPRGDAKLLVTTAQSSAKPTGDPRPSLLARAWATIKKWKDGGPAPVGTSAIDDRFVHPAAALSPAEQAEFVDPPKGAAHHPDDIRTSLAGLALSGGGIRSATFSLGVLQALGERKCLGIFDYLSTVSGGGFIGAWYSAWLSRPDRRPTPRLFPEDERLEPDRFPSLLLDRGNRPIGRAAAMAGTPDGSRDVLLHDPLHHVRTFANYLTPRKGILSGDTWRAVTIVTRNLSLTWLVMLPLLLAATLLAQLFFAGSRELGDGFACSVPDSAATVIVGTDTTTRLVPRRATTTVCDAARQATLRAASVAPASAPIDTTVLSHDVIVERRLLALVDPLIAFALLAVAFTVAWMLYGAGRVLATVVGFSMMLAAVAVLFSGGPAPGATSDLSWVSERWDHFWRSRWQWLGVFGSAAILVVAAIGPWAETWWRNRKRHWSGVGGSRGDHRSDVARDQVRSRLVRWHARMTLAGLVVLATLLIVGFSHELAWYLFDPQRGTVAAKARAAGGWFALLVAGASALFTFIRAFPSSKAKDSAPSEPGRITRLVFAVAPAIVLLALVMLAAAFGQWMLSDRAVWAVTADAPPSATPATNALLIGALLAIVFAVYERFDPSIMSDGKSEGGWRRLGLFTIPLAGAAIWYRFPHWVTRLLPLSRKRDYVIVGLTLALVAARLVSLWRASRVRAGGAPPSRRRAIRAALTAVPVVSGALIVWLVPFAVASTMNPEAVTVHEVAVSLLVYILLLVTLDLLPGGRDNLRSLALLALAAIGCAAEVVLQHMERSHIAIALATEGIGWAGFLIAWAIGIGWMADPNLISLHNFYKSRLIRAFLGASNTAERTNSEITEAVAGDDVRMKDLRNHVCGAPVHIVNATLNLVGGRDLATAQRSAGLFTISSEVCGSARTGYHSTQHYMGGTLTLGSAVAASGAAVSPNMGAKTVSAALALLLSLLNVRLGYWVPTPNRSRWREAQPRLWPFYLLREALSQTNDLGTYCYLTDGGHFDNTGVYALVERGCQYVLVLDDGAEAVRRCRIDFGAEIRFEGAVDAYMPDEKSGLVGAQIATGRIQYADAHLSMLGWTPEQIAARRSGAGDGIIIWVKPGVSRQDSVDVRQYKLENGAFPQQSTADQWYDESQFESYRALAYQVMARTIDGMGPNDRPDGVRNGQAFFTAFSRAASVGMSAPLAEIPASSGTSVSRPAGLQL
jgi:hypothetical protein